MLIHIDTHLKVLKVYFLKLIVISKFYPNIVLDDSSFLICPYMVSYFCNNANYRHLTELDWTYFLLKMLTAIALMFSCLLVTI